MPSPHLLCLKIIGMHQEAQLHPLSSCFQSTFKHDTVSEVSVHSQWSPLFLGCTEAKYNGGRAWQSTVFRKQRDEKGPETMYTYFWVPVQCPASSSYTRTFPNNSVRSWIHQRINLLGRSGPWWFNHFPALPGGDQALNPQVFGGYRPYH